MPPPHPRPDTHIARDCKSHCILDPMQKWLTFQYTFVCIQLSPAKRILELQNQNTVLPTSRVNMNADK